MIIIIGSEDEVMGFGLGGVNDAHIVSQQATKDEITKILEKYGAEDVVLVSDHIYGMQIKSQALCVRIPDDQENMVLDGMTKEILGLTLSELRERLQ